ncbi:MAG: class IV adenylate cyclase [Blastocatellia bacterium]
MPVETERKYRLNQTEAARIAAKLFEVNADFVGETEEENIIFAGRPLSGKRAVVRIRRMPNVAILTYKRAIDGDQDFKQHIEIETGIEDADATEQILKELGLKRALVYEKRRKCWRLKDVEVVIDRLPFGEFLEIEGAVAGIIEERLVKPGKVVLLRRGAEHLVLGRNDDDVTDAVGRQLEALELDL